MPEFGIVVDAARYPGADNPAVVQVSLKRPILGVTRFELQEMVLPDPRTLVVDSRVVYIRVDTPRHGRVKDDLANDDALLKVILDLPDAVAADGHVTFKQPVQGTAAANASLDQIDQFTLEFLYYDKSASAFMRWPWTHTTHNVTVRLRLMGKTTDRRNAQRDPPPRIAELVGSPDDVEEEKKLKEPPLAETGHFKSTRPHVRTDLDEAWAKGPRPFEAMGTGSPVNVLLLPGGALALCTLALIMYG